MRRARGTATKIDAKNGLAGLGTAAVITSVIALSGCVGAPAPPPVTIVATVTATPTPTPTPTPVAPPAAEPVPAPAPAPVPNAPAPVYEPGPAVDLGAADGANGTPVLDGSGMPISYTVVSGDHFFDIAQRFDLPQQQLLRMNPQIHDFGENVYIGDVINLDWTKTG
ncbi:LysM peptidoglycan-binding domain-containing protein [Agromyces subbeticus]|uniref:LysM peptidoglycan-binding domain-containing protein n=1 Tax=Agromyces subbeticus TaxID=293890 RepID=UPI0003B498A0|nr:LysM domain-containing protein [Agromyces subbeticus]